MFGFLFFFFKSRKLFVVVVVDDAHLLLFPTLTVFHQYLVKMFAGNQFGRASGASGCLQHGLYHSERTSRLTVFQPN